MEHEYSIQEIQGILSLIKGASLYAFPLIIGMVFPLFWFLTKKMLGVVFSSIPPVDAPLLPQKLSLFAKIFTKIRAFFKGDNIDKKIFLFSSIMFLGGTCFLKYGEYRIEQIRQNGIIVKNYILSKDQLNMSYYDIQDSKLIDTFSLKDILYYYPKQFSKIAFTYQIKSPKDTTKTIDSISYSLEIIDSTEIEKYYILRTVKNCEYL